MRGLKMNTDIKPPLAEDDNIKNSVLEKPKSKRLYFLDWLRALAFGYLIFFHTGMLFSPWGWHMKSTERLDWITPFMTFSHEWRLHLLFLVSGAAIAFMVHKFKMWDFTKQRFVRLFIPLVFSMYVIVAPQSYFEAAQFGDYIGNFWSYWTQYYLVGDDKFNPTAPLSVPTINHMWYVWFLFFYTLLFLPLFKLADSNKGKVVTQNLGAFLSKGARVFWVPALTLGLAAYFLKPIFPQNYDVFTDWATHSVYGQVLLLGFLFVRVPSCFEAAQKVRKLTLTIGLGFLVIQMMSLYTPENIPSIISTYGNFLGPILMWSWLVTLLGYSRKYLNKPSATINYANEAIYPFFILHQTMIMLVAYPLLGLGLGGNVEFILVSTGTFFFCWVLYEGLIRHFNPLRILFGLKWQKKQQQVMLLKEPAE